MQNYGCALKKTSEPNGQYQKRLRSCNSSCISNPMFSVFLLFRKIRYDWLDAYGNEPNEMRINTEHLANSSVEGVFQTICHEAYHLNRLISSAHLTGIIRRYIQHISMSYIPGQRIKRTAMSLGLTGLTPMIISLLKWRQEQTPKRK